MIEIQFLGTSSGIPSLTRNFPSISIKDLRSGDINLFDVGEGTQRQILRYGLGLGKIRRIFISHLHIDHFLGLYGLVET
ncbi:MAG: MBL fold metallo-hydrolase, partial [Candidatus Anstonellales archaeon]